MATNKELEAQNKDINNRLKTLTSAYSQLTDEVHTLKRNYTRLVEDMNVRLETVAKKLFRDE
jgi:predicted nuclease with TOPRIM domain